MTKATQKFADNGLVDDITLFSYLNSSFELVTARNPEDLGLTEDEYVKLHNLLLTSKDYLFENISDTFSNPY